MRVREQFDLMVEQMHVLDDNGRYRLQVGPFESIAEARSTAGRMVMLLEIQPYLVMR
ncbi:MAG: SPOR domain-containing protein [Pseudazoarcus pumilus]|nr:SPOR domain-containing protein [Pseudazoarcus pumilus]